MHNARPMANDISIDRRSILSVDLCHWMHSVVDLISPNVVLDSRQFPIADVHWLLLVVVVLALADRQTTSEKTDSFVFFVDFKHSFTLESITVLFRDKKKKKKTHSFVFYSRKTNKIKRRKRRLVELLRKKINNCLFVGDFHMRMKHVRKFIAVSPDDC